MVESSCNIIDLHNNDFSICVKFCLLFKKNTFVKNWLIQFRFTDDGN